MNRPIVVADLYQLQRVAGKFTKEHKSLYHAKAKVSESFVEKFNAEWQDSGKLYIIDEEATTQNIESREAQIQSRKKAEELRTAAGDALAGVFKSVNENFTKSDESVKVKGKKKDSEDATTN